MSLLAIAFGVMLAGTPALQAPGLERPASTPDRREAGAVLLLMDEQLRQTDSTPPLSQPGKEGKQETK